MIEKRQAIVPVASSRRRSRAAPSRLSVLSAAMRRFSHCRRRMPNPISAIFRRLPRFGGRGRQLLSRAPGCGWREGLIPRPRPMRVEAVEDDANHFCLWVASIHQPLHLLSKITVGAALRDLNVPPAGLRLAKDKQAASAVALVLVIVALTLTWPGRRWRPSLFEELLTLFSKVDLWPLLSSAMICA